MSGNHRSGQYQCGQLELSGRLERFGRGAGKRCFSQSRCLPVRSEGSVSCSCRWRYRMQSWSQADVITQLKTGTYSTTQKELSYYEQKQKFPIYPFVEVRKVQSNSATTDITKISETRAANPTIARIAALRPRQSSV